MLYAEVSGAGPRVVLVHGFTQTRRSWEVIAEDLSVDHEVVAVDAPGHGQSASSPASLKAGARLVGQVGRRASYIGYSMGARICLHLALKRPTIVQRLVLVSASPGIADARQRRERRKADEALASELERVGVNAFLERWLANPLFAGLDPAAAGVAARRENTASGLAASLRLSGTGTQQPLHSRLAELAMPVLLVAGERDAKFAALAALMARAIGANATVVIIPDAGHAAHLERPKEFLAAVRPFLDSPDT